MDFSKPQRQSPIGVLVMFFDTLRQYARGLGPLLVVGIFKFNEINKLLLFVGGLTLLIVIAVVAYLKFINFTFFLDNEREEFVVTDGIFNKTNTTIKLSKIQQVNIKQSLLQRIIGVHSLDVDTAGSSDQEISIKAISHRLALELKVRLLENDKKINPRTEIVDEAGFKKTVSQEVPFIKISLLSLLKVGVTSNYIRSIGLLLAFFATMYENLMHLSRNAVLDDDKITRFVTGNLVMKSVAILIFILFTGILLVNVIRTLIKYYNFKIAEQSGSLLLSFGLLSIKNTIIKPDKVQIVSVTRNYFQKKMNILELKVKQATGGENEERKQAIEIPGCDETERDAILKLLFNEIPDKGVMLKPNFRKLVFAIFLAIVVPLCGVYYIAAVIQPEFMEFSYVVLVYAAFMGLVLYFGFRNNRLFINDRFIIKQSGAWDVENEIIEPRRIQAITTSQLFWHKRIDIGSVILHTAGGNVAFQLGNFTKINAYVNLWLYEL